MLKTRLMFVVSRRKPRPSSSVISASRPPLPTIGIVVVMVAYYLVSLPILHASRNQRPVVVFLDVLDINSRCFQERRQLVSITSDDEDKNDNGKWYSYLLVSHRLSTITAVGKAMKGHQKNGQGDILGRRILVVREDNRKPLEVTVRQQRNSEHLSKLV
ncbi:hypothetical protein KCU93_g451, partial [Aureobasidium melanogenum]